MLLIRRWHHRGLGLHKGELLYHTEASYCWRESPKQLRAFVECISLYPQRMWRRLWLDV